jgi:hypothetical protein
VNFDDIETDTVSTSTEDIEQLAELIGVASEITCRKLEIETDTGTLVVSPIATDLKVWVDDD